MPPTITVQPQPKRHIIAKVVVVIVVVAVISGIALLVINAIRQAAIETDVKSEIIKQNKLVLASANDGVYPLTLPEGVKSTETVSITVAISTSGATYCIAARSLSDEKVIYHMDKSTPQDSPVEGDCSDGATVPPAIPGGVSVSSVGAGAIVLAWDEAPYAATYLVECAEDEAFLKGTKTATSQSLTATVSDLSANVDYYCRVAASNSQGQSGWSQIVSGVAKAFSEAPKELKIETVSKTELRYSWKSVFGATSYVLEYSPDNSFVQDVVRITVGSTSGSVKDLKTYTEYYFHVKAITPTFDSSQAAFSDVVLGRTAK